MIFDEEYDWEWGTAGCAIIRVIYDRSWFGVRMGSWRLRYRLQPASMRYGFPKARIVEGDEMVEGLVVITLNW
jgi:hypothetical protein